MAKFTIKDQDDDQPTVEWSIDIDGDGDLVLLANGTPVLYVLSDKGQVWRVSVGRSDPTGLDGLAFDADGKIVLD